MEPPIQECQQEGSSDPSFARGCVRAPQKGMEPKSVLNTTAAAEGVCDAFIGPQLQQAEARALLTAIG